MKKTILSTMFGLLLLSITACNNESMVANTVENMKTEEMANFDKAMRSLGDPINKPTAEERRSGSAELSDRRKLILVPSSKALIKSTGVSDDEMQRKTNGDITAIIVWATQINLEKSAKIRKDLKFEN